METNCELVSVKNRKISVSRTDESHIGGALNLDSEMSKLIAPIQWFYSFKLDDVVGQVMRLMGCRQAQLCHTVLITCGFSHTV
jgi:hypothetical protein